MFVKTFHVRLGRLIEGLVIKGLSCGEPKIMVLEDFTRKECYVLTRPFINTFLSKYKHTLF